MRGAEGDGQGLAAWKKAAVPTAVGVTRGGFATAGGGPGLAAWGGVGLAVVGDQVVVVATSAPGGVAAPKIPPRDFL